VDRQPLADDRADRHPRVEAGERVLKDDLHLTPQAPQFAALQREHVSAVEGHRACRRLDQAQDRAPERRLAAAGLADYAQRLPRHDVERDAVDRAHGSRLAAEKPTADRVVLGEVADRKKRGVRGELVPAEGGRIGARGCGRH
jgi:hypothetical protein